jgi:hypothetical protein
LRDCNSRVGGEMVVDRGERNKREEDEKKRDAG